LHSLINIPNSPVSPPLAVVVPAPPRLNPPLDAGVDVLPTPPKLNPPTAAVEAEILN
jgi:hypothetical protein